MTHHLPGEIERILTNHERNQKQFIEEGAIAIEASRSPEQIVLDILKHSDLEKKQ